MAHTFEDNKSKVELNDYLRAYLKANKSNLGIDSRINVDNLNLNTLQSSYFTFSTSSYFHRFDIQIPSSHKVVGVLGYGLENGDKGRYESQTSVYRTWFEKEANKYHINGRTLIPNTNTSSNAQPNVRGYVSYLYIDANDIKDEEEVIDFDIEISDLTVLKERMDKLEEKVRSISYEHIEETVNEYLKNNPVKAGVTVEVTNDGYLKFNEGGN